MKISNENFRKHGGRNPNQQPKPNSKPEHSPESQQLKDTGNLGIGLKTGGLDMDRDLIYFQMQLLQAEIEMNAMIAENKRKEFQGETPAYTETDFIALIDKHRIHHNAFPDYRGQ